MFEKIKLFLNIIIFEKFFDKRIKNVSLKKYLKEFFLLKTIFLKVLCFLVITLITSLIFFLIRDRLLNDPSSNLVFNTGVAFSFLENANVHFVYAIKIIISLFFGIIFIFSNKWYLFFPSLLISVNGWYNVIDKSIIDVFNNNQHPNAVVDYIFIANSVANSADVFITIGVCCFVVGIIYYSYKLIKQQKDEENNKDTITKSIEENKK